MVKPQFLLAITLLCYGSISSYAERIFPQTAKKTTTLKKVKNGNRPMAPATFSLICEYMPGNFKLEFAGGVDNLKVITFLSRGNYLPPDKKTNKTLVNMN